MLILGLVIGGISTALVLGMRGDRPTELGSGLKHLIEVSRSKSDVASVPSGASPEAVPTPRTSFDFYTVLPEIERIIPDNVPLAPEPAAPDRTKQAPVAAPPAPSPGSFYVLQAGSFPSFSDADQLKARLALSGLEASIQKVTIEGRGDFFRVRLGPFVNVTRLTEVDRQLSEQGVKALRLKVSKGG